MKPRWIFLDLNSYFASVEQAINPALRGKPVAVVPMLADTTCCLAASYPAKALGIKTGTSIREARLRCPNIIFIKAEHSKYVTYHHRIIKAVEQCLPVSKVLSVDEMAFELFGREQSEEFAVRKAQEMKLKICKDVSPALTCSIGIAPNRYLAKIASDMKKPDGLTILRSEELLESLYGLSLRDLPGIGARMERRLISQGYFSVRQLCEATPEDLSRLWGGIIGENLWHLLRGENLLEKETIRRTLGHSHVLAPDDRTPSRAFEHLQKLLVKGAMRLREEGYYAQELSLELKFLSSRYDLRNAEENYVNLRENLLETRDTGALLETLQKLWNSVCRTKLQQSKILRVGICLSKLRPEGSHQLSLFEDPKREKLMHALDTLNKRHRKNLVTPASTLALSKHSHAPIAFSHIPEEYE